LTYLKISVVIPSYNQDNFIERTLLSILNQNYKGSVEIIVSDGGSTDNTIEILKKYTDKIIWWSEKDNGYADAVKKGFAVATGNIFAIQSSDDYYLKDSFEKINSALFNKPDAVLICGREAIQETNDCIFGGYELPEIITPKSFLLDHPFPGIFQHTTFFSREIYEKVGGIRSDFDLCADADLFYRMLHFGKGCFLNEYIAVYQRHNTQRTILYTEKFPDSLIGMVLSCKNDNFYNKKFNPTKDEFDRFQTFLRLFYLQYTNQENAQKFAEEISKNTIIDKRIKKLTNEILYKGKTDAKFKDVIVKKYIHILKQIVSKYLLGTRYVNVPKKSFSENIKADWWRS
jgi:glycosyltransferase involved in cell wall biosynthesis